MTPVEQSHRPLNERVVLVTGGGQRLGKAIVAYLAERQWRVGIHAHHSIDAAKAHADDINDAAGSAEAFAADLSREEDCRALIANVHQRFGRIDGLVNCAAIWESKPLEEVTAADVENHFRVNTLATFLCSQHAGMLMATQPAGGAIVNFGDWATARPYVEYAAYFPSKGAIPALTRSFAAEFARRNHRIRVNAILPGPLLLPPDLPPSERDRILAGTLLQREGDARDVAHAVNFLLENEYVTGVCLPVDGGRTIAGNDR